MNCHQLIGNWKQVKGAVGEGGNKLTDDNVDVNAGGKCDLFAGKIQERHGIAREEAENELRDWESSSK